MFDQAKITGHPSVLCVSSYYPEHGGGVERVAHEIAQYFSNALQWRTTLAAHDTNETSVLSPCTYQRFDLPCWNGIEAATGLPVIIPSPLHVFRLLRLVRSFDLVMVHEEIYISNFLIIVWSLIAGVPLIVVKHTGIVPLKNHPVLRRLLLGVTRLISRPLLRRAVKTVFVTEAKRDNFDPKHIIQNAVVIPNGIDTDCFCLPDQSAPSRGGVVFVGRFVESKGLSILRHVTDELKQVPFTFVGWGPENPEDWGHPNVTVVFKPSRARIAAILRQSRLTLVPSNGEGVPLVAMEALSSGTATMLGAGSKGKENKFSDHLIYVPTDLARPEETAKAWSEMIKVFLNAQDDPLAERARHAAVEAGHSTATMCDGYASIVKDILAARLPMVKPSFD